MERVLIMQIQECLAAQAQNCESLLREDAALLADIRQLDVRSDRLLQQLESTQSMSRDLFKRICGIIEAPPPPKANAPAGNTHLE